MHYIFGSWFDPFTHAHEAIIKSIKKKMRYGDKLHILVTDNDEKTNRTPVEARVEMVKTALESKCINYDIDIQKIRMYEYISWKFNKIPADQITIVIGEDEWIDLVDGKWKFSKQLLDNYKFIVATRDDKICGNDELYKKYGTQSNVTFIIDIKTANISSSAVREIFRKNPETHYKEVQPYISKVVFNFIKREGRLADKEEEINGVKYRKGDIISDCLYNQNPTNYEKLEKKWVENYKQMGWGKFANTVDIVAYNNNKVLLIRRKKPPFCNTFATPGGFFNHSEFINKETGELEKPDADLEHAAQRELREETCIDLPVEKFEQIKTYSHMFDPRLRIIDTAFAVKVPTKRMKDVLGADDALEAAWFDVTDLPKMAFHHGQIIADWLIKQNN